MQTMISKMSKSLLISFVLTLGFYVSVSAQMPDTNRLVTGGNYQIGPPPTNMNMMFKITNNDTNAGAGDDNLIWSNSGRMLAVDRSDPNAGGPGGNKYIALLDVRNLGNVQTIGARSSAVTNPLFANITGWTWNDDRVLFGWQLQAGSPPSSGKVRLMSCTTTGAVSVVPFLQSDPQANPTNHVYSPSVVLDPAINQERLLFLVSSSTNNNESGPTEISSQPAARINLFTVPFDSGGVPNWTNRVQLTAFNTNLSITSAKWCPELGTNYQPIANRLVMLVAFPSVPPQMENNRLIVFNGVQGIIANPSTAPTNLSDSRFVVVETNMTMNSQVTWTYDGQYVMYGRMGTNPPPAPVSSDLYSMRANSSTNTAVKFEVPSSITDGQKQWLSISPDGMKAAFTVDKQVYVIPLQFDNIAVTGAVVTNVLTDASYTAVDVSGDAIPSNTTFSIVAPPSVDTNNFNGEFSGYAREFSVSGVSSQFNLATNAEMTLHFSQSDIPSGVSATNLAIYVYNPQGTNAGQTGTWDKLSSVINTNSQTISAEVQHFSIYAIGRASAQPEPEPALPATALAADFDGDRLADPALYNTNGTWSLKLSSGGYARLDLANFLGGSGYTAIAGDFDGDRLADPAVYQTATGTWLIKISSSGYSVLTLANFLGGSNYVALAGDFDGDRLADSAVYEAATGTWIVKLSSGGYTALTLTDFLGSSGLVALAADFDGDGKVDPAVYEESTGLWTIKLSSAQYSSIGISLGGSGWKALAGDIDGDGFADPAVFQPTTGNWIIELSTGGYTQIPLNAFLGGLP